MSRTKPPSKYYCLTADGCDCEGVLRRYIQKGSRPGGRWIQCAKCKSVLWADSSEAIEWGENQ